MGQPVFDHEGPWTEDAYLALPRADRVEVVEGTLMVGPGTSAERAAAVAVVREAVSAVLPEGLHVRGPVALRLGPDCVLVPDLVVTAVEEPTPDGSDDEDADDADDADADAPDAADGDSSSNAASDSPSDSPSDEVLDAAAALMVIEVIGREHGAVDRSFKPQLYAGCRIPYLLLVDHHVPFAIADMIISGRYHEYARAQGEQEQLRLDEPFPLELDLRAFTEAAPAAAPAAEEAAAAEAEEEAHPVG